MQTDADFDNALNNIEINDPRPSGRDIKLKCSGNKYVAGSGAADPELRNNELIPSTVVFFLSLLGQNHRKGCADPFLALYCYLAFMLFHNVFGDGKS